MNKIKEAIRRKSNLWHVGAVGLFILVAITYFYPALSGYNVKQSDITNFIGASQEIKDYRDTEGQPGWTNAMFSGMPATQISMGYEGRGAIMAVRKILSLWLPRPISVLFLYFISFYILAISFRMKPIVAVIGALAFGFSSSQIVIIEAGHMTKAFAIGYAPLLVAGLMFAYRWKNWILGVGLSGIFMAMQLSANHVQITYYMMFILLAVGVVEFINHFRKKGGMLRFGKVTAGLLLAYTAALLINIGNIKGTNEYAKFTTRGGSNLTIGPDGSPNEAKVTSGLDREYITAWSYGKSETMTFIVPNYKGGETMRFRDNEANDDVVKTVPTKARNFVKDQNQYFGNQPFTSGPVYLGVIVVFLALLGLVYSKNKLKWGLLAVTILTVMLSWGKNFMGLTNFFLDYLPAYNKFRAVTIILAVAQLCVPLLGVMFLHHLYKAREEIRQNLKPFFITAAALGFVLLLCLTLPETVNSFLSDAEASALGEITDGPTYDYYTDLFTELESARIAVFRKDVLRSFVFLLLSFGVILVFIRGVFSKYVLGVLLAGLILIDLGGVDSRYLNTEKNGKNFSQWTEIWKQKYPYTAGNGDLEIFNLEVQRNPNLLFAIDSVLNITAFEDIKSAEKKRITDWVKFRTLNRYTNYRVMDLGNTFNSSYASYFHKSIGGYHGAKLGRYQELIEFHIGNSNPSVLDMLNMRYQIASQSGPGGQMNSQFIGENKTAMGNAWLTKSVKRVTNADEEILALGASNLVTMEIGAPQYIVLVNGHPVTEAMNVGGSEIVSFVSPTELEDGSVQYDTITQNLPLKEAETSDLSLIKGQESGTWNWAYDTMLDSTFEKIITISNAGRDGWDPNLETVVGADFSDQITRDNYSGDGTIEMIAYHPDNLTYKSSSSDKQLAVFSEIFYPLGWKAFIDDVEVEISRVNYMLRALEVPAGDHEIEFKYELESYKKSGMYAHIGTIVVFLLIITGLALGFKDEGVDEDELAGTEDGEDVV